MDFFNLDWISQNVYVVSNKYAQFLYACYIFLNKNVKIVVCKLKNLGEFNNKFHHRIFGDSLLQNPRDTVTQQ